MLEDEQTPWYLSNNKNNKNIRNEKSAGKHMLAIRCAFIILVNCIKGACNGAPGTSNGAHVT